MKPAPAKGDKDDAALTIHFMHIRGGILTILHHQQGTSVIKVRRRTQIEGFSVPATQ